MKRKVSLKIFGTLLVIVIFFLLIFNFINRRITPKLNHVAKLRLDKELKEVASDFNKVSSLNNHDVLVYTKNGDGKISTIKFNQQLIYKLSNELTVKIKEELTTNDNMLLMTIPLGMASSSPFLNNFGPRILVGIQYIDTVFTEVKTKILDYGINNALIQVYLNVSLSYEIISPITKEKDELNYSLLIDSLIVEGVVPNLYGKTFESKTVFFNVFP